MPRHHASQTARIRVAAAVAVLSLAGVVAPTRGQRPPTASEADVSPSSTDELIELLGNAWFARDLELRMEDGTLFGTSEEVGPTALVFVGRGRVRFSPRPPAEGEQLRQFSGSSQLDLAVKWAFVRLHPDDFDRLLDTSRLEPDPTAARRRDDDDFRVSSVSLGRGGKLLFLRVREQGSLVVSLGPRAGRLGEFSLTIRYSGRHDPAPIDHVLLQSPEPSSFGAEQALLNPPPLVYSNRTAWYPRPDGEDYATLQAHFDTPENLLAVTGGTLGARSFLERHRYGKASTEDLRAAFENASGLDLAPYFERWIYDTGLPTLLWSARTAETPDGHETTVKVQPRDLPGSLPLEISLRTGAGWDVQRVALDPAGGTWTISSPDPVRDVRVNENRGILAETKKVRRLPTLPQR